MNPTDYVRTIADAAGIGMYRISTHKDKELLAFYVQNLHDEEAERILSIMGDYDCIVPVMLIEDIFY